MCHKCGKGNKKAKACNVALCRTPEQAGRQHCKSRTEWLGALDWSRPLPPPALKLGYSSGLVLLTNPLTPPGDFSFFFPFFVLGGEWVIWTKWWLVYEGPKVKKIIYCFIFVSPSIVVLIPRWHPEWCEHESKTNSVCFFPPFQVSMTWITGLFRLGVSMLLTKRNKVLRHVLLCCLFGTHIMASPQFLDSEQNDKVWMPSCCVKNIFVFVFSPRVASIIHIKTFCFDETFFYCVWFIFGINPWVWHFHAGSFSPQNAICTEIE